jgi:transcriptional antiterminator RfaH
MDGGHPEDWGAGTPSMLARDAWYLVRLKPGGLVRATANLARQDILSFCPQRPRTERRRGRLVTAVRPLFPGYLFIAPPEQGANWRSVNATYGVANVVCLEPGRPARVPTGLVVALLAYDASDEPPPFTPGEGVRVVLGPFADLLARVEAVPDKDRIVVLLDIMGRTVRARLSPADLERT